MEINSERLIKFLISILEIHSPSGQESACAEFLQKHFSHHDSHIDTAGNVVIKIPGTGEPILLVAHMDVVDPSDEIDVEVTEGNIRNKKPYVLGIDNKSTIACIAEAVEILKESNTRHRPIEIAFTTKEETTGEGAEGLDYKNIFAKEGIIVDAALPIGGIITESPFYGNLDITFSGPIHHTKNISENEQTAWKTMSEIISVLPQGKAGEKTNINWSRIDGGTGRNTVTGEFMVHGEIRSFNKEEYDSIVLKIKEIAQKNSEHIIFTHEFLNIGYEIKQDNPFLKSIVNSLKNNGVREINFIKDYGLSDVNVIINHGINIINICSGAEHTHTKDETISVKNLELMTRIILDICTK